MWWSWKEEAREKTVRTKEPQLILTPDIDATDACGHIRNRRHHRVPPFRERSVWLSVPAKSSESAILNTHSIVARVHNRLKVAAQEKIQNPPFWTSVPCLGYTEKHLQLELVPN